MSIRTARLVFAICAFVSMPLLAPARADAEQAGRVATIGFLSPNSRDQIAPGVAAFLLGLRDFGYVEGQNITIEWRFADGRTERLAALAADLAKRKVDVIAAVSTPAVRAAKQATSTIPIAMVYATDAIEDGLAISLAHPGGNVTGLSFMTIELATKQLELLKSAVPSSSRVAIARLPSPDQVRVAAAVARTGESLGLDVKIVEVSGSEDYQRVFSTISAEGIDAMLLVGSPVHYPHRARLAELAIKYRLPLASSIKEFVEAGFLLSYSPNILSVYRYAGKYVDKLLKGVNPSDLPIEQPTQFEFAINMKTAKTLRLKIPQAILLQADHVIE